MEPSEVLKNLFEVCGFGFRFPRERRVRRRFHRQRKEGGREGGLERERGVTLILLLERFSLVRAESGSRFWIVSISLLDKLSTVRPSGSGGGADERDKRWQ